MTSAVVRPPAIDLVWLGVAVLAISTSGPMIAACAAPALAIALWRSVLGSGLTFPFVAARRWQELTSRSRHEWRLMVTSGLLLGAHFALWVPSLRFTSVASATALVATQPIWAVLIARFRGASVPALVWVGIAVALTGVLFITGIDVSLDPRHVIGDAMAMAAAMVMALNVTVGQEVRQTVSTATYTSIAYAVSGVFLLVICVILRVPLVGFSTRDWLLIWGLTLVATLLGHTLISHVLATTTPTVTSLAILLEVPGATLIAAVWLGQVPPLALIPGIVLLFIGIALVIWAGDPRTAVEEAPL